MRAPSFHIFSLTAAAMLLVSCGGGGGGGSTPSAGTTTPPQSVSIAVNPQTVSMLGVGAANAVTLTASETGYSGNFSAAPSNGCAAVIQLSATAFASQTLVTPLAAGACSIEINDNHGGSATVQVTVTTTSATGV